MSGSTITPAPGASVPDSLKSFVGANTMLLVAMGAMTGLATFVGRSAGPDWSATLLQFVLTGLAFLLWLELLTQWPPALLLHRAPAPSGIPWRLVWFAYGMQLAMVGLIANVVWRQLHRGSDRGTVGSATERPPPGIVRGVCRGTVT